MAAEADREDRLQTGGDNHRDHDAVGDAGGAGGQTDDGSRGGEDRTDSLGEPLGRAGDPSRGAIRRCASQPSGLSFGPVRTRAQKP